MNFIYITEKNLTKIVKTDCEYYYKSYRLVLLYSKRKIFNNEHYIEIQESFFKKSDFSFLINNSLIIYTDKN